MTIFHPPLDQIAYALKAQAGLQDILDKSDNPDFTADLMLAILDEAGKLARDVIAPTNPIGDQQGSALKDGVVVTPEVFKQAYAQYRDAGWNAMPFPQEFGGQGLPACVAYAVQELWQASNLSFGLCPLLNQGAIEAILSHGSQAQKDMYLPKLVSGEWTGTMNLTEPQAGSDLAAIRTKAVKNDKDDTYTLSGQKIYITYGDHDLADNIIHLVLARLPDAPEGVKGISLFIVPKILEDGTRNNVNCVGLEHKLGIHASPTCVMQFDEAVGTLVGAENDGLKYMFTMMNSARLSVGLQGVAVSERALQHAKSYASERVQGSDLVTRTPVSIDHHPDVQRMILEAEALVMAGRALTYFAVGQMDRHKAGDSQAQSLVDLFTPLVKAWCTDLSERVTSLNIQIHGGMGFVEETGAAQLYRDARILPIYEGTNGIQANDLVFRKCLRDDGKAIQGLLARIDTEIADLPEGVLKTAMIEALSVAQDATATIVTLGQDGLKKVASGAYPYLALMAKTVAGYCLARGAIHDPEQSKVYQRQIDYYARIILPQTGQHLIEIKALAEILA